ncbi:hypothetical protein RCL1_005963 [Eukaryota sp. TZLM3-RCL]
MDLSDMSFYFREFRRELKPLSEFVRKFKYEPKHLSVHYIQNNCKYFWANYLLILLVCVVLAVLKYPLVYMFLGISFGAFVYCSQNYLRPVTTVLNQLVEVKHIVLLASVVIFLIFPKTFPALFCTVKLTGLGSLACIAHAALYSSSIKKYTYEMVTGVTGD